MEKFKWTDKKVNLFVDIVLHRLSDEYLDFINESSYDKSNYQLNKKTTDELIEQFKKDMQNYNITSYQKLKTPTPSELLSQLESKNDHIEVITSQRKLLHHIGIALHIGNLEDAKYRVKDDIEKLSEFSNEKPKEDVLLLKHLNENNFWMSQTSTDDKINIILDFYHDKRRQDMKKFLYFLKAEGIVIEEESKPQDFDFLYGVWSGENPNGLL